MRHSYYSATQGVFETLKNTREGDAAVPYCTGIVLVVIPKFEPEYRVLT